MSDTPEKIVQDTLDASFTTKPDNYARIGQSVHDGAVLHRKSPTRKDIVARLKARGEWKGVR